MPRPYIRGEITPGVIVILHDGMKDPTNMLAALDDILTEGTRLWGFRFVSVGELTRVTPAPRTE